MPFIYRMASLYLTQLMYADYVVMLRTKWRLCLLQKVVKIRASFLKLLAEIRGPV